MNWKEFVFLTVSGLNQDGTKLLKVKKGKNTASYSVSIGTSQCYITQ